MWFGAEYGADAGLHSALGSMLEHIRLGGGSVTANPSDLPASCVRMGGDMPANLVAEALGSLSLPPPRRPNMLTDRIDGEAAAAKQSYSVLAAYYAPPIPYEFEIILAHWADVTIEEVQRRYRKTQVYVRDATEASNRQFLDEKVEHALKLLGWPRPPKAPTNYTRDLPGQNARVKPAKVHAADAHMPRALGAFDRVACLYGLLIERSGKIQKSTSTAVADRWLAARAADDLEAYRQAVVLAAQGAERRRAKMREDADRYRATGLPLDLWRAERLERILSHLENDKTRPDTEGSIQERWKRQPTQDEIRAALRALCALAAPGKVDPERREAHGEALMQLGLIHSESRWRWQWDRKRYLDARVGFVRGKGHAVKRAVEAFARGME